MKTKIFPIEGDCGHAVCIGKLRADVWPKGTDEEIRGAFISVSEPALTPSQARKFAYLLLVAADFAESAQNKANTR